MLQFDFIKKLYDKRQYELFAEEVLKNVYERVVEEKYDFAQWFPMVANLDYSQTPLDIFYAEFSKNKPECAKPLKEKILNNFYIERTNAENLIQEELLINNTLAEKIRDQAISYLDKFINRFTATAWLSDKPYILDELKKIKEEIQPSTTKTPKDKSKKLIWYAGTASLVTLFYELNTHQAENGCNYLKTSAAELEKFILDNFLLVGNKKISASTVNSLLKPSAVLKRSKGSKKVRLKKLPLKKSAKKSR